MNHKQNTASQYDRDLEICEAATEGPWFVVKDYDEKRAGVGKTAAWTCLGIADTFDNGEDFAVRVANAAYIAHFNPTYVTQLIKKAQRCEELEVALVNAQAILSDLAIEHEDLF